MIKFYKYITGILEIEISGENSEKLLNTCAVKRIDLWDLRYKGRAITGKIGIKDFKRLRIAKRGIKAKIKITKKKGLPFRTKKFQGRLGIFIGVLMFIFILKFLSLFVWGVAVSGNNKISSKIILETCENLGIHQGVKTSSLDTAFLEQQIPLKISGISWCSVNIEGCYITVNISESRKEKDEKSPSNLKATTDGIVEKIDVTSGTVLVKIGDTVAKGDVLVSGVGSSNLSTVYENSRGTITAKTFRTFAEKGELKSKRLVFFKDRRKTVLNIFNIKIPLYLGKESLPYTEEKKENSAVLFGQTLPLSRTVKTFHLKKEKTVILSEEALKKRLDEKIEKNIKKLNISSYELLEEKTYLEGNTLTVKRTISAIENIAKEEKLNIEKK